MCLWVYPDGSDDGKVTHLSVYLCLMKGPHDDELTWPLRGKFEWKLLNQISDCEHCSDTMSYLKVGIILNSFPMKTSTRSLLHVSISKMIVSSSKLGIVAFRN